MGPIRDIPGRTVLTSTCWQRFSLSAGQNRPSSAPPPPSPYHLGANDNGSSLVQRHPSRHDLADRHPAPAVVHLRPFLCRRLGNLLRKPPSGPLPMTRKLCGGALPTRACQRFSTSPDHASCAFFGHAMTWPLTRRRGRQCRLSQTASPDVHPHPKGFPGVNFRLVARQSQFYLPLCSPFVRFSRPSRTPAKRTLHCAIVKTKKTALPSSSRVLFLPAQSKTGGPRRRLSCRTAVKCSDPPRRTGLRP